MTNIFRGGGNNQSGDTSEHRPSKLFRNGLIMLVVGFLIYLSAFVGDQGLDAISVVALGTLVGLAGIITLFVSALKH